MTICILINGLDGCGWAEGVRKEVWGWMCFVFVWFGVVNCEGVMVLTELLAGLWKVASGDDEILTVGPRMYACIITKKHSKIIFNFAN